MDAFVWSWRFFAGFMCGLAAGGIGAIVTLVLLHDSSADYHPPLNDVDTEVE